MRAFAACTGPRSRVQDSLPPDTTRGARSSVGRFALAACWLLLGAAGTFPIAHAAENARGVPTDRPVSYEAFGAVGDGVADDLSAIVEAHAFANAHGLSVKSRPDATYHLGRRALTAIISTDTDWSTSRFMVDDTDVENHRVSLFAVRSRLEPLVLSIPRLIRDQSHLEAHVSSDCWVRVENSGQRRYIRRGLNQNNGTPQRDCFILRRDGAIEGAIDWDYQTITRAEAHPIDDQPLVVRGGVFVTTANRMRQEKGYNYWSRNIVINRSNTSVVGLTHRIVGEGEFGHPYSGFITASGCANITLRDCFVSGHKTYTTIGAAGKPVSMGTYDVTANEVVNFTMIGCRMDNICDATRWGVIGTNFCKNILLENCTLSRMDTHQGVSGTYTLRGCTLGHAGLNAIGRGVLTVEDSTLNGRSFITLRSDYGSTWEGDVIIRNCRWIPGCGAAVQPYMLNANNDGRHDFGYPCYMPRQISIDGLVIDDKSHPKDYAGPYLFVDPDGENGGGAPRPFAYRLTEQVKIHNLTTTSGRKPRVSPDAAFAAHVRLVEAN